MVFCEKIFKWINDLDAHKKECQDHDSKETKARSSEGKNQDIEEHKEEFEMSPEVLSEARDFVSPY